MTDGDKIPGIIHPTAIVAENVTIAENVSIGPFCVIEDDVDIGANTSIGGHTIIRQYSRIGKNCRIFSHNSIGEIPQDLKFSGEKSLLEIGDNTTVREFCTLNRGTEESGKTLIGKNVLLMAYVHAAHDCVIGDHSILANGVQLGGHVKIGEHVIIGGMTPVHQFCKIGDHTMIGGGFRVVQDVPPYALAGGEPLKFSGLNAIGLRRRGFSPDIRKQIKQAYNLVYNSGFNKKQALSKLHEQFNPASIEIQNIINFLENSERGLV